MKQNLFVFALMLPLTGCAVAPGMYMATPAPNVPGVKMLEITPAIVQSEDTKTPPEAVATPDPDKPAKGKDAEYQYLIGPRDVLAVTVWDHPELTIPAGQFRDPEVAGHLVDEDGTIFFPYAGTVQVADKTTSQVRNLLTKGIAHAIQNPQLDVKVVAFRSQKAYLSGEIAKPGPQPITDVPLTIAQAIGQAGDLTPNADLTNATLTREGKVSHVDLLAMYDRGDVSQNLLLKNEDIIHVPDRNTQKVFVMGEVTSPSSIVMNKRGITLTEAISDAGGVNPVTSNPAQIFVIRGDKDTTEIYHLNAKSPNALILGDQFRLKPRDVVYVETAAITRWNRVIEQIVPSSDMARNIGRLTGPQ
jgi:polysaccharide export outer membrane protein